MDFEQFEKIRKALGMMGGGEKTAKAVKQHVPDERNVEKPRAELEEELGRVKDKRAKERLKAVADLFLKSHEIANYNELLLKAYLKAYSYLMLKQAYSVCYQTTPFTEGKFMKVIKELRDFFKELKDDGLTTFVKKFEDKAGKLIKMERRPGETKDLVDELLESTEKQWERIVQDVINSIYMKKRVYQEQIKDLRGLKEFFKNKPRLVEQLSAIMDGKKESLKLVEKQKAIFNKDEKKSLIKDYKKLERIDDLLKKTKELFEHYKFEVYAESQMADKSLMIIKAFKRVISRLSLTRRYLSKRQKEWQKNYLNYLLEIEGFFKDLRTRLERILEEAFAKKKEMAERIREQAGTKPAGDEKFCPGCGVPIKINLKECPLCGREQEFVSEKRAAGTKICPYCQAKIDVNAKWCTKCGRVLNL